MNKKLIITEEQYKKLKFFLLESDFSVLVDNEIFEDDIVTIVSGGHKLNFKVIENNNGQILMVNTDAENDLKINDKTAFINKDSFDANTSKINLKIAQSDKMKKENPNTWRKLVLSRIDDITVTRDNKVIDGLKMDPDDEEKNTKKAKFINDLSTLDDGKALFLKTTGISMTLYYLNTNGNIISFELDDKTKEAIGENISSIELSRNEDDVTVTDKIFLNVKYVENRNENNAIVRKEGVIKNIKSWSIEQASPENDEEEPTEEEGEPEKTLDAKKMGEIMANDEELRLAMLNYKGKIGPSKWASFIGELTGKKPKSNGFYVVQSLIDNYVDKKVTDKFGKNFLLRGKIWFEPLEDVEIGYTVSGVRELFTLKRNKIYRDDESIYYKGFDDSDLSQSEYNLRLVNNRDKYEIMVKEKTSTPNVFICDVVKLFKVKSKKDPKKTITKRSEPQEDVQIRFLNSDGYKAESTESTEPKEKN